MSDLAAVRAFAADLTSRVWTLDVLVPQRRRVARPARTETDDGHEITLATHVLGPVLLTERLLPILANSGDPRVILMSSGGMYTQSLQPTTPNTAAADIAAPPRTRGPNDAGCVHPGPGPPLGRPAYPRVLHASRMGRHTRGGRRRLPGFRMLTGPLLRTPEEGADTALWLAATSPAPAPAGFWHDRRPRPEHYLPLTRYSERGTRLAVALLRGRDRARVSRD